MISERTEERIVPAARLPNKISRRELLTQPVEHTRIAQRAVTCRRMKQQHRSRPLEGFNQDRLQECLSDSAPSRPILHKICGFQPRPRRRVQRRCTLLVHHAIEPVGAKRLLWKNALSGSNCHPHRGERRQLCGAKFPSSAVLGTSPNPRRKNLRCVCPRNGHRRIKPYSLVLIRFRPKSITVEFRSSQTFRRRPPQIADGDDSFYVAGTSLLRPS